MGKSRHGGPFPRLRRQRESDRSPPGFDFTAQMWRFCADAAGRLPEFSHIDMERVSVAFCQTRRPVAHGLYASLTPMRFAGGAESERRNGRRYTVERLYDPSGREMLYILSFYLPRFMETSLPEKLSTVFHELWHISPSFDGDLRRHEGRCYVHTHSQDEYDARMAKLAQRYLSLSPPREVYDFLRGSFGDLQRQHGRVFGMKIPRPRLIALD